MSPKTRSMISRERRTEDSDSDHEDKRGSTKTDVPVLTHMNYALWRVQIRNYLMMKSA